MIKFKFIKNTFFILAFTLIAFSFNTHHALAANKYWVGGGASSNWNATGNTNWSLTSGGANNAAVPTGTDVAIFDNNSGTGTPVLNSGSVLPASITFTNYAGNFTQSVSLSKPVTFDGFSGTYNQNSTKTSSTTFTNFSGIYNIANGNFTMTSTSFTGFSGTLNQNGTGKLTGSNIDFTGFSGTLNQNSSAIDYVGTVSGIVKFVPGMTYNFTSGASVDISSSCASLCTVDLTTAGKIMPKLTTLSGATASDNVISLQDDLIALYEVTIRSGTFTTNDKSISSKWAIFQDNTSSIINLGSSIWTITGTDNEAGNSYGASWVVEDTTSGVIINPGTSTIKFNSSSPDTQSISNYHGSSNVTYNNVWFTGSSDFSVFGEHTLNDFKVDNPPKIINISGGLVPHVTINTFTVSGTSGSLITFSSENLSKTSGVVSSDYLSISNSTVGGGATWYAGANSIDGGGNTGWIFAPTLSIQPATVSTTTATLNGTITATGGENASTRGFQYGPDTSYGTTTTESGSFSTGAYTSDITGLTCNTTYHVRSYATNGSGTHYSSDTTFTTSACPVTSRNYGRPITSQTPTSIPLVTPIPTVNTTPTVTTTPTPTTPTAIFTRDLKLRMKGDDVKYLQEYLNKNNYASPMLIIDGIYGSKTRQAVIKLQKANSLLPDGIVGEKTRALIEGK